MSLLKMGDKGSKVRLRLLRKAVSLLTAAGLCLTMFLPMTSCGGKSRITVWVYSDEYKDNLEKFLKTVPLKLHFTANIRVVNAADFENEMTKALENKQNIPDVFMLSPDNVKRYAESDTTVDVAELGLTVSDENYYRFAVEAASDQNGVIKAVGWQADPGIFMYRRSMAKVYLGTDNPDEVQAMVADWDRFYATARNISEQSGGKTRMLAGQEDMLLPYLSADNSPWVVNNNLVISNRKTAYVQYMGQMAEEHLIYNAQQWSEAWLRGISDTQSVFGYFSSGICMQYVMKKACGGKAKGEGSYGDWAVIPGPANYSWGGSWLAVSSECRHKQEAGEFIALFTACSDNPDWQEQSVKYFRTTGEFAASSRVVSQIRFDPQFEDSFIGGQNYYQQLSIVARDISLSNMTVYDNDINAMFKTCMNEYAGGLKSSQQALTDFRTSVKVAFPNIVVSD